MLIVFFQYDIALKVVLVPDMLNICPSFKAAPRTLHKVFTILSALASVRNGLLSKIAIFSPAKKRLARV